MTAISEAALQRFTQWFEEAKAHSQSGDATAMTLATSDVKGRPSARIVLLKDFNERGFSFYTNYHSHKSNDLLENPYAALCFYWPATGKQVRIEGRVEKVSDSESDNYFATRPLESKWGAWASQQSQSLKSRAVLLERFEEVKRRFGEYVPRPPHWGGWRVLPSRIEFWSHGDHRLHQRELYNLHDGKWEKHLLNP